MKKAETETNIKWTDADGDAGFVKDATVDREAGHLYIKAYEDGTGDGVFLPLDAEKKLRKALNKRRKERKAKKKPRRDEAAELREFVEALTASGGVDRYAMKQNWPKQCEFGNTGEQYREIAGLVLNAIANQESK